MFDSDIADVESSSPTVPPVLPKQRRMGQALVEYVLIVVLVSLAIAAILTATGPAIGNVFSNVVYNLLGETSVPYSTLTSNQFWNYVTQVAAYKPVVAGIITNTPIGYATNTPINTMTPGNSPTPTLSPTPTTTATVGPSPTPVDVAYSLPFTDTADQAPQSTKWHYQFTDAFAAAPWTVDFYNGATWNSGGAFGGTTSAANHHVCTTNLASAVPCFSDVNTSWVASPDTGVSATGFAAKYFYNPAPFEGREYQVSLQTGTNDGVVFKIGGWSTYIAPLGYSGSSVIGLYNQTIIPVPFQVAAGNYPVEVDFYAGTGSTHSVKLNFSTLADTGTCTWGANQPGHSPVLSWQNANGGNYAVTSNCNLRLRGSIDLSTASTGKTRLTFFDKWNILSNAVAQVGVRNYNFTTNNDWTWVTVHTSASQGNNWAYEYYDLTNFGPSNINFMTGSQRIEIAFRVTNNDPAVTAPGWFVDDITVEDATVNSYNIPVSDNSDTPSTLQWTPACSWAVTTEMNYPSGFGHSWSESPNTNYLPNSDCSLYLNGVIDLTPYGPTNPIVPQLLFYTQYYMTGTLTTISVEYASITNRNIWTALNPFGSTNPYVAQGTNTVAAWTLKTFNLNNLPKDKYYFRFRFLSDSTGTTDKGWYIDNIQWRERPLQAVGIPFAETFSNSDNWTLSGNWGLSALAGGADGNPHQTDTNSLTDSPNGQKYTIPSISPSNTAEFTPQIIIASGATGFNPVLQFWSRWDTANNVNLYLEGSINGGLNWSTLWSHMYNDSSGAFPSYAGNFNTNLGWSRYLVQLNTIYGASWPCASSCANLNIRFRLESAAGSPAADGMFIGDLAVYDSSIYNQSFTNSVACQNNGVCNPSPLAIQTNPFNDSLESGVNNWYVGGDWAVTNTTSAGFLAHNNIGQKFWTVTTNASGAYTVPEDSVLEIAPTLDFTGVTQPVVSFWTKYAVNTAHQIAFETSSNGGVTWTATVKTWITQPGATPPTTESGVNLGWTRQIIDLTGVTGATKQIRVRFRLNALTNNPGTQGWWLDDIYAGPLTLLPGYNPHGMDFADNFANLNNTVAEGDWQSITDWGPYDFNFPVDNFTPVSDKYGGTLFNSLWDVNYYHYYSGDPNFPVNNTGNTWTTPTSALYCTSSSSYISNYTLVGGGSAAQSNDSSMPVFSYTNGFGGGTTQSLTDGHAVYFNSGTGATGRGFSLTATAGVTTRTLNVYVGAKIAGTALTFTAKLHSGGAAIFTDVLSAASSSSTNTREYTITYSALADGQLLDIQAITNDSNDLIKLEGASLILGSGPTTPVQALSGSFVDLAPSVAVNLTTEGTADFAHWGAVGTRFDDKNQTKCIKPILHQQEPLIDNLWSSTNVPANAGGNANWITDGNDYSDFVATYTRKFTVAKAGTYRFWSQINGGARFSVTDPTGTTTRINPSTTTPYPWLSKSGDEFYAQTTDNSYFYEVALAVGINTFEVDYFEPVNAVGAKLLFQGSEQTTMIHSSGKGLNYTVNQDTGAYTSGYITVQPSTTQTTTLSFFERFAVGSTGTNTDPMYVAVSIDGGFTWISLNNYVKYTDLSNTISTVSYAYNLADSGAQVDPFVTKQNWQLHSVNLSNLKVTGSAISGTVSPASGAGSLLISTSTTTNILIKFELDTRVSTVPADGWYITSLGVIQN